MAKKEKKEKKPKPIETHLKQNYVDEEDLVPFLQDRFPGQFRIRTLEDGSKKIEAPRALSEAEIEWLQQLKEDRERRPSVFSY
ncbi:hypothetical protein ACEPPN_016930 [Leptodophora sp. 'Broadleaf-Isolate-01']